MKRALIIGMAVETLGLLVRSVYYWNIGMFIASAGCAIQIATLIYIILSF